MPFILRPPGDRDSTDLFDRLSGLATARRSARIIRSLALVVGVPLALAFLVCFVDSLFTLPSIARALGLAAMLASIGVIILALFLPAFRKRDTALDVALDIETKHPDFHDALASAIAFTQESSGSERLRDITTRRARNQLRDVDLDGFVPTGSAVRAVALLALAVGLITIAMIFAPKRSTQAAVRLLDPFGMHPWPAKTTIRFITPSEFPHRMAKGDSLDIRFEVEGVVPEVGSIVLKLPSQSSLTEPVPLKVDGPTTVNLDASRIPNSFEFRIVANDADTGWQSVEVAPPPRLVPRNGRPSPQVSIDPPAYSKLPSADLPDGTGVVESVAGTRVRLAAQTDRRIVAASIKPHGDLNFVSVAAATLPISSFPLLSPIVSPFAIQLTEAIPVTISGDDGTSLDLEFVPRWNGLHALTFTDESGLTGTRLFDFRLYPDPSPAVALDRPDASRDALLLLPTASVRVESRADDRTFGLRKVWLEYGFEKENVQSISIADYAAMGRAMPGLVGGALADPNPSSAFATIAGTMPLSRFTHHDGQPPKDGDTLKLQALADDWDDVSVLKPAGRSREVVIRIVSRPTLESTLQKNLVELRQPLKQTLEQENEAKKLVAEVQSKLESGQQLNGQDRDKLERAMQTLAQAKGRLTSPQDGLKDKLNELQRIVAANGLPPKGAAASIEAGARTMNRLANDHLDTAEAALNAARRETDPAKATEAMEQFQKNQQATVNGLKSLIERLDQWGSAAELRADAQQIKDKLANVGEELKQSSANAKPGDELNKLAGEANALIDRAGKMANEKQSGDAKAQAEANAIREAIDKAGGAQLSEELRGAASAAKAGRLGEAESMRASAVERLNQMTEALAEKSNEPKADELKKNRKQDAADLKKLTEQNDELRKKTKKAEAMTDPVEKKKALEALAREQDELKKEAEKLAEHLTRDRAEKTADLVKQAAEQMAAATERQKQGKPAGDEQQQADEQLQKAQQEFKKETKEADEQLEREEREQWLEQVKAFRQRQKNAVDEVNRLQAEAIKTGSWDRPKLASLADLADQQKRLSEDVTAFAAKHLEPYPVFAKLTNRAAESMAKAAKRLTDRKDDILSADPGAAFDPETEKLAHARPLQPMVSALKALDVLLDALKPDDKKKPNGDAAQPPMPMEGGEPMPMDGEPKGPMGQKGVPPIAQLKVLRALQLDVNERTADFHKRNPDPDKYDDEAKDERSELERDQKEIAELFEKMLPLLNPMTEEMP